MTQQASTAVQQTANGGQVATQRKPVDILKSMMSAESVQEQFKNALGKNSATFVASVIDLYNGDSNLQLCNPKQVVMEALKAATLHLPINKALGYAFIIPFKNSKKDEKGNWIKVYEPTFQMGYKGYIQLAMRTGQYRTINADVLLMVVSGIHGAATDRLSLAVLLQHWETTRVRCPTLSRGGLGAIRWCK